MCSSSSSSMCSSYSSSSSSCSCSSSSSSPSSLSSWLCSCFSSCCSSSSCSSSCVSRIIDMTWYNYIFIIIMFIACFDYMSSIVGLVLCLCPCSYSAYPMNSGVGGRSCVSVVLRHYLSANAPYILGHVVDREGDYYSFVESSVVHSPNVGQVRLSCEVISFSILDPP
jgi:hypothetical protein